MRFIFSWLVGLDWVCCDGCVVKIGIGVNMDWDVDIGVFDWCKLYGDGFGDYIIGWEFVFFIIWDWFVICVVDLGIVVLGMGVNIVFVVIFEM